MMAGWGKPGVRIDAQKCSQCQGLRDLEFDGLPGLTSAYEFTCPQTGGLAVVFPTKEGRSVETPEAGATPWVKVNRRLS